MPHDVRKLLRDMQQFITELEEFRGGRSLEQLEKDVLHLRAVEMQFVLISEVLKRMEAMSPEVHHRVDSVRDIAGMRNTIVHDYDEVDIEIVHDAASVDIPILKQQMNAWADELGMEPPPGQTA